MSDDFVRKTAEDFRRLAGQPGTGKPATPDAEGAGEKPPATPDPRNPRQVIEDAVERAVARALAANPPASRNSADDMQDFMTNEMRNVLPGRIRQELFEQLRTVNARLSALEEGSPARSGGGSLGRTLFGAIVFALVAAVLLGGLIIFERPLRQWGHETVFPTVGLSISEAVHVRPAERKAPPLGNR